jgi:glycosyltransferase involved in cell wall biosynthesis/2-polyprenyl-3-methyl-5-hydroxy-6-metoxy-1,4-benzoquinol methylase
MKFSVICLTYKRPHLLEESIYSVLSQTLTDWEMVIVNDCPEQILHFEHPQVRIFNLSKKFDSLGQKRNFAIAQALGDLIINLDDDDLFMPNYLELISTAIGTSDWLIAQKPVLLFGDTDEAILSPVPQYNTFVYRRETVGKQYLYDHLNYDEISPFYFKVTKRPKTSGTFRQLRPGQHGYLFRQNVSEQKYRMSQLKDGDMVSHDELLTGIECVKGDITLVPKWHKDYVALVKNIKIAPPPASIDNKAREIEELVKKQGQESQAWGKVKPSWENAKKFLSAVKSRGLVATALDVVGIDSTKGERVSEEIYNKRKVACFGDSKNYIAPCRRLVDMGAKGYYCGGCGCGNNDLARLDAVEGEYSKLHYPDLECPLGKEGFSNAKPSLASMSIIIPVLNDQSELDETIKSIRATSPEHVEIIVVDDASDIPVVVKDPSVKLMRMELRRGVGRTRWLGALQASRDYLLFIDSHMRFTDDWYQNAIDHLSNSPSNVVWCAKCLGLEEGHMDVKNHRGAYCGAEMCLYNAETGDVFEGKWIPDKEGDDYDISCLMGACYFFHKSWFFHIKGTSSLKMWGSDEPLVSIKTWLAGGSVKLMKSVQIGHKFRSSSPYLTGLPYLIYNKLRSMYMLFPTDLYQFLQSKIPNSTDKMRALAMFDEDREEIEKERDYYKTIFTRDMNWFCDTLSVSNPTKVNSRSPLIRVNNPCGLDENLSVGREPCQGGWYEWVGRTFCKDRTVLDVGAGMCSGLEILKSHGASFVQGQDVDKRLKKLFPDLIVDDISYIDSNSFDVVTSFDAIEHVLDDKDFFRNLLRIAKRNVIITTPNFARSAARNHFHCREYTIPQFVNTFSPDELWVASPDGRHHLTLLLKKEGRVYLDLTRGRAEYEVEKVPEDLTFTHSTVDGAEWPHICGLFCLG